MTAASASQGTAAGGASPFAGADICAIAGLGLPPGRKGPVFEQDVWELDQVIGLPAYLKQRNRRLDFTGIRNLAWRTVAKEYCAALLAPRHDPVRELPRAYRNPLTLQTCALKLGELTRWLNWLTGHGVTALGQVTDWHCQAYAAERSERRDSDGGIIGRQAPAMARAAETVIELAHYRELFSSDGYLPGLRPFGGRAGTTVAGLTRARNGENSTPLVPDDLLRPVLAAALYLVRTLAPEVWPLQQEVRAYLEVGPRTREKYRDPDYGDIEAVLRRRIAEGRPLDRLPATKTRERVSRGRLSQDDPLAEVSLDSLAREAGRGCFHWHWLDRLRPAILSAAEAVGVEEPYGRNAPMVTRADGNGETPWTLPIPGHQVSPLVRSLRTACIIVIAAVSGMRASEISELAAGCRRPLEEPVPGLVRYRLASKVIKGQPLGGTDDEWVVTREVFDAIEVAEHLAGDAEAGTLLFGQFTFNLMFQCFRSWVNGPAGQRLGLQEIPDGPLNPRMLRRTLAVELAYRPGGLLAAKIQLKHVSCATTEGYAARPGGAQSRLLAEVTHEEAKRNLEVTMAEYQRHLQGIQPSGPGARDLVRLFESVDGLLTADAAASPNVIPSDQQVRTMLARRAGTLHLGTANYCWFTDPSRALCLKLAGTPDADRPLLGMCDSARCPQATHHACHRPAWEASAENARVFLGSLGRGQKTERARLEAELARSQRVLSEIDAASSTAPAAED
jgi:integrase